MQGYRMRRLAHVPALAAAVLAASAQAQVVDEVDIRREGANAVVTVRFTTEVQFQRSIATRSGDLLLVSYQLINTTNSRLQPNDQVARLRPRNGLPGIEVADEPERGERARRLVVRFAEPTSASARAGRNNRSIEIVLKGQGEARVPAAPAPVAATPAPPPAPRPAAAAPAAPSAAPAAPAAPGPATSSASTEIEERAAPLMARARAAQQAGRWAEAIEAYNQLLELPPNSHTAEAQQQVGRAHLRNGDPVRARVEFETYLKTFPDGPGAEAIRRELAGLSAPAPAPAAPAVAAPKPAPDTTLTGSVSSTYYGGNGQVRSRDFQDSPIAGLPQVAGEPQLSSDRSRQIYSDVDVNWRRRNAEVDQRFVLRDSYLTDLVRSDKSRNRLSALYFDHRSISGGWGLRVGRQSPTGGGIMGRFDGLSASYTVAPRVKLGAALGDPTDRFFASRRRFAGVSLDADRVLGSLGGSVFAIQQRIDGVVDRQAVGLDLRWFKGGTTLFAQFDYDLQIRGTNIASVQGTWILEDNTVLNALFDRRALTLLTLGNSLTFGDPANPGVLFRRIDEKLASSTLQALRDQVRRTTPMVTQAQLGITKPWSKTWQTAASLSLVNTGAIPPVPEVSGFEQGRPATGNVVTASAQLIGLNLYSSRDTHVLSTSLISGPSLRGVLMAYNNSSFLAEVWQLEPSLQYYRDRNDGGSRSERWTPGLRLTYRGFKRLALESALTVELGRASRLSVDTAGMATTTEESTRRVNYSLGMRYEY